MSLRFRKRLLEHLKHDDYTPRSVSQLRDDLGVEEQDHAEFDEAIEALKSEKLLEVAPNGAIGLPSLGTRGGTVLGKFRKAMKGFGFVEPLEAVREGSIFIPPEDIKDALSGDVVRVAVRRDKSRDRFLTETPGHSRTGHSRTGHDYGGCVLRSSLTL